MLPRKLRTSLTLRIFFITCLILLAACSVTYGIIALATPISYISMMTDQMTEKADALPAKLAQSTLEGCGPIIDEFIRDTDAKVMIVNSDGIAVGTPSNLSVSMAYENEEAAKEYTVSDSGGVKNSSVSTVTISTNALSYAFSFQNDDRDYTLCITPPIKQANRTVQALGEVAPWILCIMLVLSALCALVYSRWLTRPIVRLSGISQKLAELDFSPRCEEKRLDEIGALGRSLNTLSDNLSAALGDLQTANDALQRDIERERELERQRLAFFAAASHELKTPVTILRGQLTGMLEGVGDYKNRDRYLAKALGVTGRMEGLVQEIMTVSRMESGDFALNLQSVDLAELVQAELTLDDDLIAQKSLALSADLPKGTLVSVDTALMKKVLDNILSNAVFYAPENAKLRISLENGALSVENSGSHIPEEALPHVFEAFYRAEGSRNRRSGGSGLGLYIVRMILERHGLRYQLENTEDGVRFTIWFDPAPEQKS